MPKRRSIGGLVKNRAERESQIEHTTPYLRPDEASVARTRPLRGQWGCGGRSAATRRPLRGHVEAAPRPMWRPLRGQARRSAPGLGTRITLHLFEGSFLAKLMSGRGAHGRFAPAAAEAKRLVRRAGAAYNRHDQAFIHDQLV